MDEKELERVGAREKEENGCCVRNGERVGREKTD